jgi:hypothetical protein
MFYLYGVFYRLTVHKGSAMSFFIQRNKRSETLIPAQQFKHSLQKLSEATVSIVTLLALPAQEVTPSALGSRLALFLNALRMHHTHALAIGALQDVDAGQLVEYLHELRQLRGSIARWLTIHAAQPRLIFVEIADFEAQCWSVMGMGVVLLDSIDSEEVIVDCPLSSRFHQWWDNLASRPVGWMA